MVGDLCQAARPMLAVSGGLLAPPSTPLGRCSFFHHERTPGSPVWQRVPVKAANCPRIPAERLEAEREDSGERWYRQEDGWTCPAGLRRPPEHGSGNDSGRRRTSPKQTRNVYGSGAAIVGSSRGNGSGPAAARTVSRAAPPGRRAGRSAVTRRPHRARAGSGPRPQRPCAAPRRARPANGHGSDSARAPRSPPAR